MFPKIELGLIISISIIFQQMKTLSQIRFSSRDVLNKGLKLVLSQTGTTKDLSFVQWTHS